MTWSTPGYIYTPTATVDASDHFTITAEIQFKHNLSVIYFIGILTALAFLHLMMASELITNSKADLSISQLREQYHTTLNTLLDKHAPVRSKP
jgi:hypothetical protein